MAGRREVRCVGPSYPLADRKASAQRTVNMYLSAIEGQGEDKQYVLKTCPGVDDTHGTFGVAVIRGVVSSPDNDRIYFVSGNTFKDMRNDGLLVLDYATTLSTSSGDVRMAAGNGVVIVVDGTKGYVVDINAGLVTQIGDPDWRGSYEVEFLDGYFIFVAPDSDQFYLSAIDDASNLDALDFSSADRLPDKIIAARVSKQQLYLFGTRSTEIWINNGGADFPFARYSAAPIDIGIVGRKAVVKTSGTLFFCGKSERGQAMVYMLEGNSPRRVSTLAVEESLLSSSVDLSECVMWTYQPAGAEFVGIEAPGMRSTWVYDIATGQWHERCRISVTDGLYDRMHILDVASMAGSHFAAYQRANSAQGVMNKLNTSVLWGLTNDEPYLPRERTWPHLISPSAEPVRYSSLELMCTTGQDGGQVTLEISNDGGNTYGDPMQRSLGVTGRFMERVRWHFLGQARDRVFRVRCSDNVAFNIHGAQVEA